MPTGCGATITTTCGKLLYCATCIQKDKQIEEQKRKEQQEKFKFSNTSYKAYSDFEFNIVNGGSTWYLHRCILQKRCPRLLSIDKKKLKSFNLPENTYESLITFIYQDKLLNMDFLEMIDFHMLLVLCEMQELASYIISEIMLLCPKETAVNIALAFSKLMKYPEFNTTLFDSLYSFVLQQPDCDEAIISSIIEGPGPFVKLASHRMLLAKTLKHTDKPSDPFGKLHKVVEELFPSEYQQGQQQQPVVQEAAPSSSSSSSAPSSQPPNKNGPDFTIKCEDRTFVCHKLLLVLRWPYFAKVMTFNGIETKTNTLELAADTLTAESTEILIRYLYTNRILSQVSASVAHNILLHAQYFEMVNVDNVPVPSMELLIEHCRSVVFQPLTTQYCIKFLKGALEYGTDDQVKQARTYISNILRSGQLATIAAELKTISPEESHRLMTWEIS